MADKQALIDQIAQYEVRMLRLLAPDRSAPFLMTTLTIQQLKTALVLQLEGSMTAQGLADTLGVSLATGTGIVDRLVAHGLVERGTDPDDRRVRRISLTAAGTKMMDEFSLAGEEIRRRILERLDLPTLEGFATGMGALLAAAEAELGGATPDK